MILDRVVLHYLWLEGCASMECIECKAKWDDHKNMVAAISFEVMGNEHSYTYWLCPDCGVYTKMWFVDIFLGPEETMKPQKLDRATGDKEVAEIKKCPSPDWKRCKCPVHQKLSR